MHGGLESRLHRKVPNERRKMPGWGDISHHPVAFSLCAGKPRALLQVAACFASPSNEQDTLPERSKGVDSSSTSESCAGSNPAGVNLALPWHSVAMKPTLGLQLFVDDCIDFAVIAPQCFRIVISNAEKFFRMIVSQRCGVVRRLRVKLGFQPRWVRRRAKGVADARSLRRSDSSRLSP